MDGDFAPMIELAKLRKKYGFLLVIDDVSLPKVLDIMLGRYISFMVSVG